MELLLASFAVLVLAFVGLALGALLGRAPLRRGCAGLGRDACRSCTRTCHEHADAAPGEPVR